MRIRSGDTVLVVAGKDKGKTGRVERQETKANRVVVEGVNLITRHVRPRPNVRQSGRIQQEAAIHVSNVVLVCNKCAKPTKPKTVFLETGTRVRSCPLCEEVIDDVG